jgi:hypothetical protein
LSGSPVEIKIELDVLLENYNDLKDYYKKERVETKAGVVYTFEK